jgi:hypothetical protein
VARVIAVFDDLLLGSNVLGMLQAAGHEATLAGGADVRVDDAAVLVVDLGAAGFDGIDLVARLRAGGFRLLDTQFVTEHLARLGAVEISRAAYHRLLERAIERPASFRALPEDASRQSLLQLATQTS